MEMSLTTKGVSPNGAKLPVALFPGSARFWLVAFLMAAYTAGYAWSAPTADTADELLRAYEIRHGIAYPLEGPFLGGAFHFGPMWFYLTALPLWISHDWLAVAIHVHPTSAPVSILVVAVLWLHYRRCRTLLVPLVAFAAGFLVSFIPYVVSQIRGGFADWVSATAYMSGQVVAANIVNTPT